MHFCSDELCAIMIAFPFIAVALNKVKLFYYNHFNGSK
jgi:hypothetical protein